VDQNRGLSQLADQLLAEQSTLTFITHVHMTIMKYCLDVAGSFNQLNMFMK